MCMNDFKNIIKGLREVFKNGTRDDKYRCITTCPKEYTIAQIKKIFPEASTTLIRMAKKLQSEQGNYIKLQLNFQNISTAGGIQLCQINFYISFSDILCLHAYINNFVLYKILLFFKFKYIFFKFLSKNEIIKFLLFILYESYNPLLFV